MTAKVVNNENFRNNKPLIDDPGKKSAVYGCIVQGCVLRYKTLVGLKRHLDKYDHEFYGMTTLSRLADQFPALKEAFIAKESCKKVSAATKAGKRGAGGRVTIDVRDIFRCEEGCISKIFRSAFLDGIIRVKHEADGVDMFFCRIPGCGKSFKSQLAYKYHCRTFSHALRCLASECGKEDMVTANGQSFDAVFSRAFGVKDEFEVLGITHHMFRTPDIYPSIRFNIDKKAKMKRRAREAQNDCNPHPSVEEEPPKCRSSQNYPIGEPLSVSIGGKEYCTDDVLMHENLCVRNLGAVASCCAFVKSTADLFVCVALKESSRPTRLFEFGAGPSRIVVLDSKLQVLHRIDMEFGFVRKMVVSFLEGVFGFVALFNDGKCRTFKFREHVFDMFEYALDRITTFCYAPSSDVIIATDGFTLHKIENRHVSLSSMRLKFPIVSMAIRDVKDVGRGKGKAENKKVDLPVFFYLDTNGRAMCCDSDFRNETCVYKLVGVTDIMYIDDIDFFLLVDSFELVTRYIHLKSPKNTHILCRSGLTCVVSVDGALLSGGFDDVSGKKGRFLYTMTSRASHPGTLEKRTLTTPCLWSVSGTSQTIL
ncbi:UNVERIFIED_CONTAM: hypothetical protein PYX00_011739 [Menopon gallinae]|uniref:C2H2-type domain-containing protein n=1 Tax=Menopon gallinae TaxID=328185 RepID=A0AAW2H8I8_9NEOP